LSTSQAVQESQQSGSNRLARGWMPLVLLASLVIVVSLSPARRTDFPRSSSLQVPQPVRGQGYHLVKDWDFATTVRDEAKLKREFYTRYVYDGGGLDFFNDERERYRDNANHVFEGGALAIVARLTGSPETGQIESGMLRSKWTGKYGYFECRMKVPSGRLGRGDCLFDASPQNLSRKRQRSSTSLRITTPRNSNQARILRPSNKPC
jgi:hypothetical protein